jgi:hypothetical protein
MMLLGFGAKMIEDHSRLNARNAARGVDFEDAGHVLRKIEDDSDVAALSGERGAATASKKWSAMFATQFDRGQNVFRVARSDYSYGNLAVVRTVGGVEGSAACVKANFSAEVAAEDGFESYGVNGLGAGGEGAGRDVILGLG